jgi:hypothetical protein
MKTFYGSVQGLASMFTVEDGKTVFRPWNDHYGTVRPSDEPGTSAMSVEFDLNDGEFFQVREQIDKSEGRLGTKPAGNFLDYAAAYRAADGKNAQGYRGEIVIMSPDGADDITAQDADGNTVLIESRIRWRMIGLPRRLRFPNRDA